MKKIVFFIFFLNVYIIGKENNIKDIIKKADSYYSQKKYEEAIDFYKEALPLAIDIEDIIALKIKIGDCYFENKDYSASAECYKTVLWQFYTFEQKEYVIYKLCSSIFQNCPKSSEIDLTNVESLLRYIKYYKNNFSNGEYLSEILDFEKKAEELLFVNDFSNIKFYYDNKLYFSAIFCCDWFLKKYENKKDTLAEVFLYKIKSQYELSKRSVKLIKKNVSFEYDFFKKLRQNIILILECMKNDKIYLYNKEMFDNLFEKCYLLLRNSLCLRKKKN